MKNLLLFLLGLSVLPGAFSQDKDLFLVASAGASYQAGDLQLDWTLGEVMIQTLEKPSVLITQGFHQPDFSLIAVKPIAEDVGLVLVLPNPFSDELSIKMNFKAPEKGLVELYDMTGRKLWGKSFYGRDFLEKYSTSSFAPGSYILVVSLSDDAILYSYQLIKTQ